MRKIVVFRSKYKFKIIPVLATILVAIALISSSSISITINKISKTENIKLIKETQISADSLTGLAPDTIETLSTGLAPFDSNNAQKLLDCEYMYGYTAALGPHGEGPCYFAIDDPSDIIQLSTQLVPNFFSGGTWTCEKRWIVCEYSTGALYEIDPENGDILDGWGGGAGLNGLAIDPTTNTMYGCSSNDLYKINLEDGSQEYIGDICPGTTIIAIACDSSGTCYGWDVKYSGDSWLYEIDLETGDCTPLFSLGVTLLYAQDGAFCWEDDTLYLTAYITSPLSGGYLCSVDIDAEELTIVGKFENGAEITGSMFMNSCFQPEHDVGVKNIVSPENGDAGEDMDVIVKVKNNGKSTEEDISVNVVILKDGIFEDYNETDIIDELHPDESIDFEMPAWTPDDWQSVSNEYIDYKIVAHITLEGDEYPKNDYKEKLFELYFGYFHDVGCIDVRGPETGPAQTFPVKVTIKNFGQYDECCFNTYIEISEIDPEYEDIKCIPTIKPGQEIELVFDDWTPDFLKFETSGTKNYIIKTWTEMDDPPDENPDNDLITKSIILDYYHDVCIKEISSPSDRSKETRRFYAVDCSGYPSSKLIWFDPEDPGTFNYISNFPSSNFPQGATYVCNVLWVCDTYGNIWKVNPETGEIESVGNTGTGELVGLSYHEKTDVMYGMSTSTLYTIDMDTGVATHVGYLGTSTLMISLDCDEWSGIMYAYDLNFASSKLYKIDLETGEASAIGNIGFSANYGQDMAYDCVNKTMYACVFNYGTFRGEFHWVNLETGEFNFIGVLQNGAQTTAFAIPGCCLTPKAYVPIGVESIVTIVENIGTFPETDMVCYAEMYEYITNCSNGSLVYEDNITNIDIEDPLGGTETLTFDDYNFETEGFYGLFLELVDDDDDYPDNNLLAWGIGCDDTPPSSIHSLDPPNPDGLNGWYVSDLEVTLSAEDSSIGCGYPGSGIDEIRYTIDGESGLITGDCGTFTITEDHEGEDVEVEYWAVDNVGNAESHNSFTIDMDQTPPDVDITYKYEGRRPPYLFIFTATATDAESGMERFEFYLNAGLQETVYGSGPEYVFSLLYVPIPVEIWKAVAYDMAGLSAFDTLKYSVLNINSNSQSSSIQNKLYKNINTPGAQLFIFKLIEKFLLSNHILLGFLEEV